MTRTEFYNGWQICIMSYGNLDNPVRIMMAFGSGGRQLDFSGYVIDEDLAIEGAKKTIDYVEGNDLTQVTVRNETEIDDFPDVIGD